MPPTGISQPRPASPESATLVVLQAYGDPTDRTSSSNTASRVQSDTDDTSPLGSPNRSELRLSAISCSSTVNLVSPHPDNGPHHHGEFKESPFRWNYPSLPDLPLDQQEIVSENVTNNGKQPAMRLWEGWRVIICCSCKNYVPQLLELIVNGVFGPGLNFLLLLIPVSVSLSMYNAWVKLIKYSGSAVLLWENITS